jgi:hypothetical protein
MHVIHAPIQPLLNEGLRKRTEDDRDLTALNYARVVYALAVPWLYYLILALTGCGLRTVRGEANAAPSTVEGKSQSVTIMPSSALSTPEW